MPPRRWLEHYATVFSTVELNVTFYRLPRPRTFDNWYERTPPDFGFAVKGSRFITHVKKIGDPEEPVALFFDGALRLREKLLAVLWQFPPGFGRNIERLRRFLELIEEYPVRQALEFRNESWITDEVASLCREHDAALCMADWPDFLDGLAATADFVYVRRHGEGGDYASPYSTADLRKDAARIKAWLEEGRDVFVYFNNDALGHAPANARELLGMLARPAGARGRVS
ncbi:MAG: DUF72 domain-containing protein [Deltaproteobacteria bacterium]|nr:DUF72 domain-containing protein [Deltaproteobacteria bacterium]